MPGIVRGAQSAQSKAKIKLKAKKNRNLKNSKTQISYVTSQRAAVAATGRQVAHVANVKETLSSNNSPFYYVT